MRKRSRTIRLLELTGVGTSIVRRLDASDHSTSLLIKGGNTQMLAASASNSLIQTYAVCDCDEITNLSRLLHFCFFFICVFAALVCNDSLIKQACIRLWRLSPNCSKKLHSFRFFFCVRILICFLFLLKLLERMYHFLVCGYNNMIVTNFKLMMR